MASKTGKRANAAAKKSNAPAPKDDGTRWLVVRHGRAVYPCKAGFTKAEAKRLAGGLVEPAEIIQVS